MKPRLPMRKWLRSQSCLTVGSNIEILRMWQVIPATVPTDYRAKVISQAIVDLLLKEITYARYS